MADDAREFWKDVDFNIQINAAHMNKMMMGD
jgi:hypothetical protein